MADDAVCAHCGLPIAGLAAPDDAQHEPDYCCFGCRMAAEILREAVVAGELGGTCLRLGLSVFLSLNVMIFTMWLWTQEVYGTDGPNGTAEAAALWSLCRYACLAFSLPVLWMLGRPVAEGAWQSLLRGAPTTDLLMILGTAAAFVFSAMSTLRGSGPVYFEIGCAVLLFVTLGRYLEARGKQQAAAALESLERLLPDEVRKFSAGELISVPLDSILVGDRLEVRAGERIPVDGRIVRGTATLDSRVLTGESRPQYRESGDDVLGGTLNLDGDLLIEATATPRGGTWQRLLDCMRTARKMKGRHQQLADRVARWFMPAVAVIAAATFVHHARATSLDHGLSAALAVVLVACPCALGLATPLAVWAGLGAAAQSQVLFRNGEALERLAGMRVAAFDKTGTLTDGRPTVADAVYAEDASGEDVIRRTYAAAAKSGHDLSLALVEYCRSRQIGSVPTCEVRTEPGRGLTATFCDLPSPAALGNERLMRERRMEFSVSLQQAVERFAAAAMPLTCIGWNGRVQAVFGFHERLRESARSAVEECRRAGLSVLVLTGDHAARGAALAEQLDVSVRAELLPDDKVRILGELRRTLGPTVMVGDGLNDAPALTAADVGMALGCGADVSRQSADVCLLGNDPARVAWSVGLARQTLRIVRQNLFWSFAYNAVGIGLAAAGWLNPIWAAVMMTVGGLSVVGNSLRLAHYPQPNAAATNNAARHDVAPSPRVKSATSEATP